MLIISINMIKPSKPSITSLHYIAFLATPVNLFFLCPPLGKFAEYNLVKIIMHESKIRISHQIPSR